MRTRRLYSCNTSFLDLLFNMLLAFTALFVLSFCMVNENKDKSKSSVEVKAEYIITMSWPEDMDNDIDLYVEDPIGNLCFFRRREEGLMHLDRDDIGFRNDFVETPSGKTKYPYNREIITLRGFISGEYCVNAHAFKKNDPRPCQVTVQVDKLNPTVKTILVNSVTLLENGQEKTVMRFRLDSAGGLLSSSTLDRSLISEASRTAGQ